jgi:hypothetical protein
MKRAWLAMACLVAVGCGGMPAGIDPGWGGEAALAAPAPPFIDLSDYLLRTQHSTARLGALERMLRDAFDDICMDTFCEGDYGNLTPLSWRCSVSLEGAVQQCLWVIAGSAEFVDAGTGDVEVDGRVATCAIPVRGSAEELLDTLLAEGDVPILNRRLPGVDSSVYDSLSDCL